MERGDYVYMAKLAEQAERYDGKWGMANLIMMRWGPVVPYLPIPSSPDYACLCVHHLSHKSPIYFSSNDSF